MGVKYFGAAVKRREDPRFLRGEARYVEDVVLPGMLRAAFVRSPHAHARIASIRTDAAKAMPGVAVFTHADLERWMKPLPLFGAVPLGLAAAIKFDVRQAPQYALCRNRARHVGDHPDLVGRQPEGDFRGALEAALKAADYDGFRREQTGLRARGVHQGIGISGYVEGTAIGPYEGASVRLDLQGRVVVATGAVCSGQGHETSFAQVAADALGVPLDWVTVIGGDTATVPFGVGTFASRSAVTAGSSIVDACAEVRRKVVRAAAALLEAAPQDVEIEDGRVFVRGAPNSAVDLARVVQASIPTFAKPGVAPADFEASAYHHVPTVTYASAVHVAVVEVDHETGAVKLLRYVVAHDCGKVINPIIVDGQVHGGVAQGVGGALGEEMVYDEQGQLLTQSLMDYFVPHADDLPPIETVHLEFPSTRNPLGAKGLGEGGAISPPAAIANAVEDALAPFGVKVTRTPLIASRVRALVAEARARGTVPG